MLRQLESLLCEPALDPQLAASLVSLVQQIMEHVEAVQHTDAYRPQPTLRRGLPANTSTADSGWISLASF